MALNIDTLISLCKRRGIVFQSSEIYGGLASTFDYGPVGVELKRNVKDAWWRAVVQQRDDMEGLDASILMHPKVWEASGHVASFTDPLVECKGCRKRFRADHLNGYIGVYAVSAPGNPEISLGSAIPTTDVIAKAMRALGHAVPETLEWQFKEASIACPDCGQKMLTAPRQFNLMFRTQIGPVEEGGQTVYLRPETAQGIFVNYQNVLTTSRRKLPFGIAQIGKSFRNEVTTRSFIFRTLEFEQMEIEYFVEPAQADERFRHWLDERFSWYQRYGIRKENLRLRQHAKDELAHYAADCYDVEYQFPMGWSELEGIANRTDYDLKQHSKFSGKDLTFFDQASNRHITPYVIEPSAGVDRSVMAFLCDSYREEEVSGRERVVLSLHPALAPVKIAVLPLLRNRPELVEKARALCDSLRRRWRAVYDDTAAIGKLYRRQDEIGTPYCVTVDVDSLEDGKATVRERDAMSQERVALDKMVDYFQEKFAGAL